MKEDRPATPTGSFHPDSQSPAIPPRRIEGVRRRLRFQPAVFILGVTLLLINCQLVDRVLQRGGASRFDLDREETIFLVGGQPQTLDPAKTHGGPAGPVGHIFSGLTTLNTELQVQPDLAAGWTVSQDGLVYTFYLRKNAVFHDGRPVTAEDVIFSWERATDPKTGSDTAETYLGDIAGVREKLNGQAETIRGVQAFDDHTLEVRLNEPIVYFLAKLAYPVTFVVDRENVSQSNWEYQANGTGPFTLREWRDDEVILLERFESTYLEPAEVRYLVLDLGPGLPLAMYEDDEIDLVGLGGGSLERALDPDDPLAPDLRLGPSMCTSVIGLNNNKRPFDDLRVRQAFNYALDKELLIEAFSGGNALFASGALPPGMPGYSGENIGYPFDPESARRLLAEAGYPDGHGFPALTYMTSGYGDPGAYVTAVITMWQENLNVTIEPVVLDPFVFLEELYGGEVGDIYSSGWCADYPDPQNFLDVLYHSQSSQNVGRFADPEIDALLERARVERDVKTRLTQYAEIERRIVEAAPVIFVSHGFNAVLVKPRLEGYVLTPIGVAQWHRVSINEQQLDITSSQPPSMNSN